MVLEERLNRGGRPVLAYVVNSLNAGGTEKLVVEMSRAFAARMDISVLCLDVPGVWANELRNSNISVHCLWRQPGLDLSLPLKMASYFRANGVDIVHAHQCTAWFYAALSRLIHAAPFLILEEHGRFYPEVKSSKRILVNRVLIKRLTHRFVAVSKDIQGRLVQYEGLDRERIEIVYNGVSSVAKLTPQHRSRLRADFGFSAGDFVVGTVGRFDAIKNIPLLVKALHKARAVVPEMRGLLVGSGPEFGRVEEEVNGFGLSDCVRMCGFREDARSVVQCLDLFVLPSFSEGTSMALLEAMLAGVPVAVTDVGGNSELVINGECGWIVPSNAVDALSAVLAEAGGSRDKRVRYSRNAMQRVERLFAFERMIENYRRMYDELLYDSGSTGQIAPMRDR